MGMEEKGEIEEASGMFLRAWDEAENDFERYIAAYFVARRRQDVAEKLKWFQTSLPFAVGVNNEASTSAFPSLYSNIAKCYEELGDVENAKKNRDLADSYSGEPSDSGPFYHGTKAGLQVGDLLTAGGESNYTSTLVMNHIYFTALANGAGLAAALAKGEGSERVYMVEPTGSFENDPNVTDKKFPGNPTRSYRSHEPLKIVGEVTDWAKQTPDDVKKWRDKLANSKGEIIN